MADDLGDAIYRAMVEDADGLPVLGLTAVKLGVALLKSPARSRIRENSVRRAA